MKRHRYDPVSFVFGLVFCIAAVALSVDAVTLDTEIVRWGAAFVLLAIGAGLVLGSSVRRRDEDA